MKREYAKDSESLLKHYEHAIYAYFREALVIQKGSILKEEKEKQSNKLDWTIFLRSLSSGIFMGLLWKLGLDFIVVGVIGFLLFVVALRQADSLNKVAPK